jgi:hypothetical protein
VHAWVIHACKLQQCPAGSLVWASDPARLAGFSPATWAELDPAQKKTSNIVVFLLYLFYGFVIFFILWKYKSSIKIPGFSMKCCKYIYMSEKQKIFSCVLHTANTLTCFECFFLYIYTKKTFEVSKMCFRMDFLNTTKNLFSCISGFYNMFVKLQRVLANIPKNTKILFLGNSSIIHR